MGFWSSLGKAVSSAASWVGDKVEKTASYVSEKYHEAKSYVEKKITEYATRKFTATINTTKPSTPSGGNSSNGSNTNTGSDIYDEGHNEQSESEKIATISQRKKIVSKYQSEVEVDATYRESTLKETFLNMYDLGILDSFDNIFDTTKIRLYIEKQSKRFDHVMRDEVNRKVSPKELEEMANSFHGTAQAFDKKVNKFAHSVYKEAMSNLEDLFVEIVNETNKTIKEEAEKYLKDENESLNEFKQTLINLSAEGHDKEEQLKTIALELTTMEFVKHEVNNIS